MPYPLSHSEALALAAELHPGISIRIVAVLDADPTVPAAAKAHALHVLAAHTDQYRCTSRWRGNPLTDPTPVGCTPRPKPKPRGFWGDLLVALTRRGR